MADNSSGGTNILIVDDEKLIRLTMSTRLRNAGYSPVAVETVEEAVSILKEHHRSISAIISDIMMGDMDGFVFRDIVRGMDPSIPFFFLTALDPEEGSGFLKRIVEDPMSFYLPKAASTEVLVGRVQRIVASRRVEQFIVRQIEETKQALGLAAYIQRSMLPLYSQMEDSGFYTVWWHPQEVVSGDLVEVVAQDGGRMLYVLGDIQGHGIGAALAMTAVQAMLKRLPRNTGDIDQIRPSAIANQLQDFFRHNLANVSYMTALIMLHDPAQGTVRWISCGAPDLTVYVDEGRVAVNPGNRGGLPIGLMPDTRYSEADEVETALPPAAVCLAFTDGIFDLARQDGTALSEDTFDGFVKELAAPALKGGSVSILPHLVMRMCAETGYGTYRDDVTLVAFGNRKAAPGIYEAVVQVGPEHIDAAARKMGDWCMAQGWSEEVSQKLQLVLEEKMMNLHDHGFDERERQRQCANIRLRRVGGNAALTVWDCGTPEPSMAVAAGSAETAFELANRDMSNHGRGRLMLRSICSGIARNRFGNLNETIYNVPMKGDA